MITTHTERRVTEEEVMEKLGPLISHPNLAPSVSSSDSGDDEDDPMSYFSKPLT